MESLGARIRTLDGFVYDSVYLGDASVRACRDAAKSKQAPAKR
jgi:hypothetical protein